MHDLPQPSQLEALISSAATSARWGYYHQNKNEASVAIQNFNALMKTQYDAVVKSWRLDGGKEYFPQEMGNLAAKLGQVIETTTPYFPEQDGRAERTIGIIISRVRTVSIDNNIPKFLWPELVRSQLQIANRTATPILDGETPIQAFNRNMLGIDEKPDLSHIRILGCKAYVQIPIEKRIISQKLDKRAEVGMLVSFEGQHIYRVYIPSRRKIIRSSVVKFDENGYITNPPVEDEFGNEMSVSQIFQLMKPMGAR